MHHDVHVPPEECDSIRNCVETKCGCLWEGAGSGNQIVLDHLNAIINSRVIRKVGEGKFCLFCGWRKIAVEVLERKIAPWELTGREEETTVYNVYLWGGKW